MGHATVKLRPGVDQTDTPVLNEAGISTSQLIRFFPDPVVGAVPQKLGGWTRFFPSAMTAIVRALWAWEDTNAVTHLAFGTQNYTGRSQLGVITNGTLQDITPRSSTSSVAPAATATMGLSTVVITDASGTLSSYDTVYIETHIAVGGLILFGLYPTTALGATTYQITARDALGNPLPAPSTSSTAVVADFSVTTGASIITVTLPAHGYSVGSTYPALVSTTVGGITIYGNYTVNSVIDANTFTIQGAQVATATTTGFINGGNALYVYSYGVGAIPGGTGYGIGGYGLGGYGTGTAVTPSTGSPIMADDWTLDNWGQILVSCPINTSLFQPIYQWDPLSGAPIATIIPQAPPLSDGMFVAMPQRQIVAWGTTVTGIQDPLLIRWCDVNNFNVWIGTVTNQAGQYRIPRGSRIVAGIQGPQQGLIWTDLDIWAMQYVGPPYVYSFNQIGSGCGLIARKAAASLNGTVYWMGPSQFFMLSGDGVSPIPCPVWDVIFQNLDKTALSKIRVAVNSLFGEVTWYYPSLSGGGEVDSYVKYNTLVPAWDYGLLGRSAWIDQSVLGPPIGADPSSLLIYQHETSPDADGQPLISNFTSGYYATGDGDMLTFIDQFWPDLKWGYYGGAQNATVQITLYGTDYPGQTPTTYGPYSVTQATKYFTPRIRNRLVAIEVGSSDMGSFWRMGGIRYRWSPDGRF